MYSSIIFNIGDVVRVVQNWGDWVVGDTAEVVDKVPYCTNFQDKFVNVNSLSGVKNSYILPTTIVEMNN